MILKLPKAGRIITSLRKRFVNWLPAILTEQAVPTVWLKPLLLRSSELCIFVTLARNGGCSPHSIEHARAWHQAGFDVLVVVVTDDIAAFNIPSELDFVSGVLLRSNHGYDFAAWSSAIIQIKPTLRRLSILATVNDSIFGPLNSFGEMLKRVRTCDADFIGLTESFERTHHYQSYLLFFKSRAIRSQAFAKFWGNIRIGDREFVITYYELQLLKKMSRGGLRCLALFAGTGGHVLNPTLGAWRELIHAGFPYIKVQLLRDNPHKADLEDWQTLLTAHGYNTDLVFDLLPSIRR
jgi:lipopolysaccharide biosynthesis protein